MGFNVDGGLAILCLSAHFAAFLVCSGTRKAIGFAMDIFQGKSFGVIAERAAMRRCRTRRGFVKLQYSVTGWGLAIGILIRGFLPGDVRQCVAGADARSARKCRFLRGTGLG